MKFKLPDDPQERNKMLALIGIFAVLILVGIGYGVITPYSSAKKTASIRLEQVRDELEKARKEINKRKFEIRRNLEALTRIEAINDTHMLKPILGNYLLAATAIVDRHCRATGVARAAQPSEIGMSSPLPVVPTGRGAVSRSSQAYTARITLREGLAGVIRLIRSIETENPYISIPSLTIQGNPGTPERHKVTIDLQWPVWMDDETPARIKEALKRDAVEDEEENEDEADDTPATEPTPSTGANPS
ncbi:MAG: hypothetical protein A2498_07725 [Lentisphaerae bacterium RIFOXYC12_FULL_60_16]|nr:MAG: hypothetical protein A2498_07725 [Lentisphaerae bacterium RIFOXYC12_FULL_60_16]OGV83522.1 MAG: hypothetical protein A2340_10435 [Lentisphaerae bacterium RIFOXYB12_FULL_60_10]